MQMINYSSV